ncbi:MAG: NAD-dependent protein deacetylase [Gammaproteobacteria bacterium]|jgi:NAD-dependent SIR2 family protein deacetylase|nr:NAD-dependent protein deacetylase [Gammaproteobacteria bacterium]
MTPPTSTSIDDLTRFVTDHSRLFVLTGAGISTASGIPDYRDTDGAWKRSPPVQYGDFVRDPAVRRRYWARSLLGWPAFAGAAPNASHHALANLEHSGHVSLLVTQNVDGLHQAAGSRRVIDLHGRLDALVCLDCRQGGDRHAFQHELETRNPDFTGLVAGRAPDGDADLDGIDFTAFDVPDCPACGGLLKPDVVFFGEGVPRARVDAAYAALDTVDALLVIGSSLMVYSGFRFAREAAARGLPVAALNRGRTRADDLLALKVEADCGMALNTLTERLADTARG